MSNYTPDNWVIIKIKGDDPHYRVLAGWSGGYLYGDSWRMNSGITGVEKQANLWGFYGASGSVYWCHQGGYGLRMNNRSIWSQLQKHHGDKVEMMPEDTDWLKIYGIKKVGKD